MHVDTCYSLVMMHMIKRIIVIMHITVIMHVDAYYSYCYDAYYYAYDFIRQITVMVLIDAY